MSEVRFEWDPVKALANAGKHGIEFADAVIALEDDLAITIVDPDSEGEQRFVSIGADPSGCLLVTIFALRGDAIRIISSRRATGLR